MKRNMLRKGLAVAVILLSLGVMFASGITACRRIIENNIRKSDLKSGGYILKLINFSYSIFQFPLRNKC